RYSPLQELPGELGCPGQRQRHRAAGAAQQPLGPRRQALPPVQAQAAAEVVNPTKLWPSATRHLTEFVQDLSDQELERLREALAAEDTRRGRTYERLGGGRLGAKERRVRRRSARDGAQQE